MNGAARFSGGGSFTFPRLLRSCIHVFPPAGGPRTRKEWPPGRASETGLGPGGSGGPGRTRRPGSHVSWPPWYRLLIFHPVRLGKATKKYYPTFPAAYLFSPEICPTLPFTRRTVNPHPQVRLCMKHHPTSKDTLILLQFGRPDQPQPNTRFN
jgi:hypothetical protein